MTEFKEHIMMIVLALIMAVTLTHCLPVGLQNKDSSRLSNLLSDIQTLRQTNHFSTNLRPQLKRNDERKERQNYGLIIELKDPVKIEEVPSIGDDSRIADDSEMSDFEKRQGRYDADYGLGGGRFGKRGFDYSLGGGRFGRDVDHVDPSHVED